MNVLRQAEKAGVKKFVVTSSIITMTGDPTVKGTAYRSERRPFLLRSDLGSDTYFFPFTDWNPVTKENGLHSDEKHVTYAASLNLPCGSGQKLIQTSMSPQVS